MVGQHHKTKLVCRIDCEASSAVKRKREKGTSQIRGCVKVGERGELTDKTITNVV